MRAVRGPRKKSSGNRARAVAMLGAAAVVGATLAQGSPAAAAGPSDVIFIGDSVTAGFGYFGAAENASGLSNTTVNTEFGNNWKLGDSSLDKCDPPATPDDRCSNNNYNGQPWNAGPWTAGPGAPNVAYSYQIAASQNPAAAASVENWAITGSTPANWDPNGGYLAPQLNQIQNQTVVMTLGANPLLDAFLDIKVAGYPASSGACSSVGEYFSLWGGWWANTVDTVVNCAQQQWTTDNQSAHLTNVYNTLLNNGNQVMVLGYYANCPWSFANWQPEGNVVEGPASGNACTSQSEEVDSSGNPVVSQWDQAMAVVNELDSYVAATVAAVQQSNPNGANLQFVLPNQAAWQQHQASSGDSWVFKNDTWIHPSAEGHGQLAQTVTAGMCADFGQWCGTQPTWVGAQAQSEAAGKKQKVKGKVRSKTKPKSSFHLPSYTKQGQTIYWKASKNSKCHVYLDQLVAKKKAGSCKLTAKAIRSASLADMVAKYTVKIER